VMPTTWRRARAVLAVVLGLFANNCASGGVDGSTHFITCKSDAGCPSDQTCGDEHHCVPRTAHTEAGADGGSPSSSGDATGGSGKSAAGAGGATGNSNAGGAPGTGGGQSTGGRATGGGSGTGARSTDAGESSDAHDASATMSDASGTPGFSIPCGSRICAGPAAGPGAVCCRDPFESLCGVVSLDTVCILAPALPNPDAGDGSTD
jgi:hypothetical protein